MKMTRHLCFLYEDLLLFFILSKQTKEQLKSPPALKCIGSRSTSTLEPNVKFSGAYEAVLKIKGVLLKLTFNRSES